MAAKRFLIIKEAVLQGIYFTLSYKASKHTQNVAFIKHQFTSEYATSFR